MKKTASIPVILGQTASGKTSVGIELAQLLNGEIISVDSRKVYRGLPIGTATPPGVWDKKAYIVDGIPHYLMGHLSPDSPYNAGDFAVDAEKLIDDILARGKMPLLVGGTGFYFNALKKGLPSTPPRNDAIRNALMEKIETDGLPKLQDQLKDIDPVAAKSIAPNDLHKVIRAHEVYRITGKPFSQWKGIDQKPSKHSFVVMGPHFPKALIDERIESRSQKMADQGMIEEARALLKEGFSPTCPALSSFGYSEAVQVIHGTLPKSEFLPRLIKGTKAYAKRQRTWFRTQTNVQWFDCDSLSRKKELSIKMKDFYLSHAS